MATRTTQLAIGKFVGSAAIVNIYTVPAGKRVIVKSLNWRNGGTGAGTGTYFVYDAAGVVAAWLYEENVVASRVTNVLHNWVLNAGQSIRLRGTATAGAQGDWNYIVSGAVLGA